MNDLTTSHPRAGGTTRRTAGIALAALLLCACASTPPGARLYQAVKVGDLDAARKAIDESKGSLNDVNGLFAAIDLQSVKAMEYFLDRTGPNSWNSSTGQTVLMRAAGSSGSDGLRLLLARGAAVNRTDKKGWTALDYAHYNGRGANASMLASSGATAALSASQMAAYRARVDAEDAAADAEFERQRAQDELDRQAALQQSLQQTNQIIQNAAAQRGQATTVKPRNPNCKISDHPPECP